MNDFKTLDDLPDIQGRVVLVRADLNVPFKDGKVTNDARLHAILPTLEDLAARKCKIVLLSHFGRPEGQHKSEFTLKPIAARLNELYGLSRVKFIDETIGGSAQAMVRNLDDSDVLVLENLRFFEGEERNRNDFIAALAALGDIYINDAFSTAHREHASTVGLARVLPAFAGRLMETELRALSATLDNPSPPVTAIVGGAKVSTKLSVLHNLIKKTDHLILGGGMANTFLFANGCDVGTSLYEPNMKEEAQQIIHAAKKENCTLHLPSDVVIAREFKAHTPHENVHATRIPSDSMALDIGAETLEKLKDVISQSKTVLWNGPLGAFETPPFDHATTELARYVAQRVTSGDLYAVGGGGDTVSALEMAGVEDIFSYVSTAGGAFLEYIEGKDLPGVAALKQAATRKMPTFLTHS